MLWANTVLYEGHPMDAIPAHIHRMGQPTDLAALVEDKVVMGRWRVERGFPVVRQAVVRLGNGWEAPPLPLPVVKPIRGPGSHGVQWVADVDAWERGLRE